VKHGHPQPLTGRDVMSVEEIRSWLAQLKEDPSWGGGALAQAIGLHCRERRDNLAALNGKIKGTNWIYPSEQLRFTRQIRKILAGEIVCRKFGKRFDGVLAEHPIPLRASTRLRYDLSSGRLVFSSIPFANRPTLPSFQSVISGAAVWDPPRLRQRGK